MDYIGNHFKSGPVNNSHRAISAGLDSAYSNQARVIHGTPSIFLRGNIGYNQQNPDGDQWVMAGRATSQNGMDSGAGTIPSEWRRGTKLPVDIPFPVVAESAADAQSNVLALVGASRKLDCAGNWVPNRDAVDNRQIAQYRAGTIGPGKGVFSENDVGGYPTLAAGTPCVDSDLDGMPNEFESARPGLSNSNAADRNGDLDNDGYTNLEEYMDGVPDGGQPPPPPPPPLVEIFGAGKIIEKPQPLSPSSTGKVDVKGGPERRPFGKWRGAIGG